MLKKKLLCALVAFFTFISLVYIPVAAQEEIPAATKLSAIEETVYGASFPGSLLDRTEKLERDILGEESHGPILTRINSLYSYIRETSENSPSMIMKTNAVEWMLTNAVTHAPIQARISSLETIIGGTSGTGGLVARLGALSELIFPSGEIEVIPAIIAEESLIKVKLLTPLHSKHSKEGDPIDLVVSEDFFIGSTLIIPVGAKGVGRVVKSEAARNFGRDAKLEISIDQVETIDNSIVETLIGEKSKEETLSLAKATGASVAGIIVLGPVGIIGGAFISGKDIDIPANTQIYVQTKSVRDVFGVTAR